MAWVRWLVAAPLVPAIGLDLIGLDLTWAVAPAALAGLAAFGLGELALAGRRPARGWWVGCLVVTAVAVAACAVSGGWSAVAGWGLIVFAGALAARRTDPVDLALITVAGLLAVASPLGLLEDGVGVLLASATLTALTVSVGVGELLRAQGARVREARQLAQAEERAQLAGDLHDLVAHEVTGIAVLAQAAAGATSDPGAGRALATIERSAREALGQIRQLVQRAAPGPATAPGSGLAALRDTIARFEETTDAEVQVSLGADEPPAAVGAALQRTLTEGLTNVRRHAEPTQVAVVLTHDPAGYRLVVRNDGAGAGGVGGGTGRGLSRARERAALLGGQVSAGPAEPGTWVLEVVLP